MGRVTTLLDVGTFIKIAATAVVALLAFGAMATPAWAQDTTTLSVDKSADPDPVVVGQKLTYTIEVTNTGTNDAVGTLFSDDLVYDNVDVHLSSMSVSTTAGTCEPITDPTEVTCALGDLAPGQKATITIELVPTSTGTINNTAYAEAGNAPSAQDTVSTTVLPPTISVEESANPDPAVAGQELTYTFVVTNTGTNEAENAAFGVTLALGTVDIDPTFTSASSTVGDCVVGADGTDLNVLCDFGNLAPGETATVTLRLLPTSSGEIEGEMVAGSDNYPAPGPVPFTTTVVSGLPGEPPPPNGTPESKQECKKGGYEEFGFKNQGLCIKAVNHPDTPAHAKGPKNPPPGFDWHNNIP